MKRFVSTVLLCLMLFTASGCVATVGVQEPVPAVMIVPAPPPVIYVHPWYYHNHWHHYGRW